MKRRMKSLMAHFQAALAAFALLALGGCATVPHDQGDQADLSRVKVDWTDPSQFADVRENPATSPATRNPEEWVASLSRWLQQRAARALPAGDRLDVTFTDIKRAGAYEPWRGPQWMDVRIIKDIYSPRIDLRFTLRDARGNVLSEGTRSLKDMAFLRRGTLENDDPLRYEKRMLEDWLRTEFASRASH